MAVELAKTGVTVNSVCPGFVETDMARDAIDRIENTSRLDAEQARRALEKLSPQDRLMQTSEVLHLVRSLVAEGARGINGQAVVLDGGQVLH
jgi:NAD(P)-dependent dehydrogenase (short-subunit alcohol dehydrogenase family)